MRQTMTGKLLCIKEGKVDILSTSRGEEKPSAIKKIPVKEGFLTKVGLAGDEQADKKHHGGETKAILFFSVASYEKLSELCYQNFSYDEVSHFGENFVVLGMDETTVCVGDIFHIGEAVVEVSQPREPCSKLSLNTNYQPMTKTILETGLTGWYARVLKEGKVCQGEEVILTQRGYPHLTIQALNNALRSPSSHDALIQEALACDVLGEAFKRSLGDKNECKGLSLQDM